jgi:hypothetical protein
LLSIRPDESQYVSHEPMISHFLLFRVSLKPKFWNHLRNMTKVMFPTQAFPTRVNVYLFMVYVTCEMNHNRAREWHVLCDGTKTAL